VNYADCIVRMGLYASANELVGWPITPGFEVAGTVAAVGGGVTRVAVGQRVMAVSLFGGYATRVVIPEHQVFALPERLSVTEAAGMPAVYLTAWYALCELCKLRPGMKLLVHSAAGGVGGALLQIARLSGCTAVGVVRGAHKVESATQLGASVVIDKGAEDLWAEAERHAPGGYDIVLDANGVETLAKSYQHTASGGRLVIYGFATMMSRDADKPSYPKLAIDWLRTPRFNPLDLCNQNKSVLAFNLSYLFPRKDLLAEGMGVLAGWVAEGKVVAPPVTTFPLDRVADAHRAIESGKTVGKLVLEMPG
jgi:NADPH:quinone reductase-like Zn-dependent oxidoreductase